MRKELIFCDVCKKEILTFLHFPVKVPVVTKGSSKGQEILSMNVMDLDLCDECAHEFAYLADNFIQEKRDAGRK